MDKETLKPYIPLLILVFLILVFGIATFFVGRNSSQTTTTTTPIVISIPPAANAISSPINPPQQPSQKTATPIPSSTPLPTPTSKPTPTISAATITFSGTVQFSGQAPVNSRIAIFRKITGATDYQLAVDNLTPFSSSTWNWTSNNASYDMLAILKQKQTGGTDTDLATSNTLTLSGSSTTSGTFVISYAGVLSAPSASISVTCNSLNSSSQTWSASVSFQTVTGAQAYWYKLGTTSGGSDLANFTQNALSGTNQVIPLSFKNGTTYYAEYAYAGVPNILIGSSQLSPLSATVQLRCQ